jgi:hypothetical protein
VKAWAAIPDAVQAAIQALCTLPQARVAATTGREWRTG